MATRVSPAGSFTAGLVSSAADLDTLPGGKIARVSVTANSGGTTTTETIASITLTLGTDREFSIRFSGMCKSNVADSSFQVTIMQDGVQIQRQNFFCHAANVNQAFYVTVHSAVAAGSHTYDFVTGVSGSPTGTVIFVAAATQPGECEIWDDGPKY